MFHIFVIIAPLFVIIFCAAFLRYVNFVKEDWSAHLNQYALKIGLPALIFTAITSTPISLGNEATLVLENSIFIVTIFFLSFTICKACNLSARMHRTVVTCLMFSNVAYLGIPVLTQIYTKDVLPQISIIIAVYLLGLFGLGIAHLEITRHASAISAYRTIAKDICTNPLLIAAFLGICFSSLHIPLPHAIATALDLIAQSVTPIVLIVIGIFIGQSSHDSLRSWYGVALFSLATLIFMPALFYFGTILYGLNPSMHNLSILESAMPLGITPFALADQYGLDKHFIARSIVLSTALSVITLPFWVSFIA